MKVVSLAVSEETNTDKDMPLVLAKTSLLRDKVFWLPDIPPEGLLFNDHSKNMLWQAREQRPYNMILFGGHRGDNLSALVQIVVWIVDSQRIYGIDFIYNTEIDGCTILTLGRRGPFANAEPREWAPFDSTTDKRIVFDIDGPNGEMVSHVELRNSEWGNLLVFA